MSELLSCPFCGGEASKRLFYGARYGVYCDECDARVGGLFNTEEEAIKAWNTRTPEQAIAAMPGSGKLTAEQVREAVMSADRWEKPMGNTGLTNTHLIIRDDGWQAIADELNAKCGEVDCDALLEWLKGESE